MKESTFAELRLVYLLCCYKVSSDLSEMAEKEDGVKNSQSVELAEKELIHIFQMPEPGHVFCV